MSSSTDSQIATNSQSQSTGETTKENAPVKDHVSVASYPIIPRDELELGEQLGAGAYGSVYKGVWKTCGKEVTVALKKVFMLEKEADILSKVRHRNIIQFFGVSKTNPDFFIVTEFAPSGSLYDYVHQNGALEITFEKILNWAIQIAQGVSYLHYEAPETIIHRDLKSKNVVLSCDLVCKLCDFGTSKNLTHSWTAPSWGGTAAWMSPEIISQKEGITTATDVWSYAVVLWEMIAQEVPYKGLTEFSIYSMIAQQGVTLVIPEKCPRALAELMRSCWKINPKERFDMKQVVSALEEMLASAEITEQCGAFLKLKGEWKFEIERQIRELEEQKIDYAKKLAELAKREQALRRREDNHRGAIKGSADLLNGDVAHWDANQVCQWIHRIAPSLPLSGELLDGLVALILHHNINGSRLLDITPKDLECLGICSLGLRVHLFREIKRLRKENHRMKNFPTLEVSHQLDQMKRLEKQSQSVAFSLVIHVTMYTRQSGFDFLPKFRYKIVVDTDWEEPIYADDLPEDFHNSQSLVRDVCISIIPDDKSEPIEPFMCTKAPFALSNWVESPVSGGEVEVVCAIAYSDCVIRPRNTCIRTKIFDFSRPQTLDNRKVEITVRTFPSSATSPRRNSVAVPERQSYKASASADSGVSLPGTLLGVWRDRASSSSLLPSELDDSSPTSISKKTSFSSFDCASQPSFNQEQINVRGSWGKSIISDIPENLERSPAWSRRTPAQILHESPLWADIAAGITSSPTSTPENLEKTSSERAKSMGASPVSVPRIAVCHHSGTPSPQSPIRLPSSPAINPFFRPENLCRDSVIVTCGSTSNVFGNKSPLEHHRGFRSYPKQQVCPRKSSCNVIRNRRRLQPIILPPRRKLSYCYVRSPTFAEGDRSAGSLGFDETVTPGDLQAVDAGPVPHFFAPVQCLDEHLVQNMKFAEAVEPNGLHVYGSDAVAHIIAPMQRLCSDDSDRLSYQSSATMNELQREEELEEGSESAQGGKKRKRRRRRPHKRNGESTPKLDAISSEPVEPSNSNDAEVNGALKSRREVVHGGYQKWGWK